MVISVGSRPTTLALCQDSGWILGPRASAWKDCCVAYEWAHLRPSEWRPGNRRLWLSFWWWWLKWTHTESERNCCHNSYYHCKRTVCHSVLRNWSTQNSSLAGGDVVMSWRCGSFLRLSMRVAVCPFSGVLCSHYWCLWTVTSDRDVLFLVGGRKEDGHGSRHPAWAQVSHGQRSLAGASIVHRVAKSRTRAKRLSTHAHELKSVDS